VGAPTKFLKKDKKRKTIFETRKIKKRGNPGSRGVQMSVPNKEETYPMYSKQLREQ